jgi:hypothetical protein
VPCGIAPGMPVRASFQPSSAAWYRAASATVGLRISGGAIWLKA